MLYLVGVAPSMPGSVLIDAKHCSNAKSNGQINISVANKCLHTWFPSLPCAIRPTALMNNAIFSLSNCSSDRFVNTLENLQLGTRFILLAIPSPRSRSTPSFFLIHHYGRPRLPCSNLSRYIIKYIPGHKR